MDTVWFLAYFRSSNERGRECAEGVDVGEARFVCALCLSACLHFNFRTSKSISTERAVNFMQLKKSLTPSPLNLYGQ